MINRVVAGYLVLAAPVVAAVLFWGSWGWLAAAAVVGVVEYATLRRSQRFSARLWRSVGVGRRSSHERATERIYVVAAVAALSCLAWPSSQLSDCPLQATSNGDQTATRTVQINLYLVLQNVRG